MAFLRMPLLFNKGIPFYKLMGSGKNGTFDKTPDWKQWALLAVHTRESDQYKTLKSCYGRFIHSWSSLFCKEHYTLLLTPMTGHGQWDGQNPFGAFPNTPFERNEPVATLTRATIRFSRLSSFWKNVPPVAIQMSQAAGFIFSAGIGEVPWIKQATFSIWESTEAMQSFAYRMKAHSEVVKKTRSENWYSEDMFVRFRVIDSFGTIHDRDPFAEFRTFMNTKTSI
ncbi:MAG: spheroidene monooxygenase [Ferruginibacter sp.]